MTKEQSRQLGQALMGFAVVQLLLFLLGAAKKSYAALALPVFFGVALASMLMLWVGWTMAANRWDEDDPE